MMSLNIGCLNSEISIIEMVFFNDILYFPLSPLGKMLEKPFSLMRHKTLLSFVKVYFIILPSGAVPTHVPLILNLFDSANDTDAHNINITPNDVIGFILASFLIKRNLSYEITILTL